MQEGCHQCDQKIGKKSPNFWKVAKTIAKPNNAQIYMFLNSLFRWKCSKFVAQGVTIFGAISSFQRAYKK